MSASKKPPLYLQFCLMLLVMNATAHAHDYVSHRHAAATFRSLEIGALGLDMMLTLQLTGRRAVLLQQRFDLNRDGHYSEVEALLVAAELRSEALGGLQYQCSGVALKPKEVKQKVHRRSPTSVVIAFLLTYDVPKTCGPQMVVESPSKSQRKGLENLAFVVAAIPPLKIDKKRQVRFTLMPGQQRTLNVVSRPH